MRHKFSLGFEIKTDHLMLARRSDLEIPKKKACRIVNVTVPVDHRVKIKENKKRDKCLNLKNLWNLKVMMIHIITGALGMLLKGLRGCPRGVMVKAMDCGIIVREFVLQSRYYVHFRANTLGKGMNPLILPAMG